MKDTDYKGINTLIRTYELRLLKSEDMERLLKAESLRAALEMLRTTDYDFDIETVINSKDFNGFLMAHLHDVYQELYELAPEPELLDLFTLRYSYHNLKVMFKERFLDEQHDDLLIPIGEMSLESLRNLVETGESSQAHPIMVEAVQALKTEFEESGRIEAVTVYMDTYYLRHLRAVTDEVNYPSVTEIADTIIDMYNLTSVVRSQNQDKPRSHLYTLLSSAGSIAKQDIIDESINGSVAIIRKLYAGKAYSGRLESVINDNKVNTLKLDQLMNELIHEVVSDGFYQAFGPLPLLGYIYAKETEVTNLRLILVGKDNGISEDILRERVRLVYGS
ncbi:V-type ATPase subunit [Jeotgalibaca dankookensis]|uniref:V-type ATPase subunit n=1 Tax=Jeotgalibaca dankookensis TaxID=708126 RepID=UPI00078299B9|nr:V-type ATPase subunit [Jeotgalibaca dankookensis]